MDTYPVGDVPIEGAAGVSIGSIGNAPPWYSRCPIETHPVDAGRALLVTGWPIGLNC